MTGAHTADSTDSVILLLAANSFAGADNSDESGALAFADDGTREGFEVEHFKDRSNRWAGWGLAYAKLADDTSSHTYTLRWDRVSGAAETSPDPRSFQVLEFIKPAAAAAVYPPFPRRQNTLVRM